jgi:transportin-3
VSDHLELIAIFLRIVSPYVEEGQDNPAVAYCQEIFPVLATILESFITFSPIAERVCRCWRYMVLSYRTAMAPLLPQMATKLVDGFAASKQGCFLWASTSILREFSEEREFVDPQTTEAIYSFFEAQARNVLRMMSDLLPKDLPDVIEDFFRLVVDALLYYPSKLMHSDLFSPILAASISALALEQRDPLIAVLHYIRDVIGYGGENPPTSSNTSNPPQIQQLVKQVIISHGESLVKAIMVGMMITFPDDCFQDGSGALLGLFEILPQQTTEWVDKTVRLLPAGTVSEPEINKLNTGIRQRLSGSPDGIRKVRSLLQDFTNTYRRRYVAPRDGLGRLEVEKFRFNA